MDLLLVTEEEKAQILKLYNIDKFQVEEDIALIKSWKSKQPHLPGELSDNFIEKLLLKNKFSVERTKQKIESYYTIRGLNKDIIEGYEKLVPSKQALVYIPLPKITSTFERITVMKIVNTDPKMYDFHQTCKLALGLAELSLQYDGSLGTRLVVDLEGLALRHLATWNPVLLLRYVNVAEQAYSMRFLGLDHINCPPFMGKVYALFRLMFRPKIYERIRVHENIESLYKVVPKEYLPVDYGGRAGTITDLLENWDEAYKQQKSYLIKRLEFVSREDLRLGESTDDGLFGVGGTFKKLSLD